MDMQNPAQEAERVVLILLVEAGRYTGDIEESALQFWHEWYARKFERAIRAGASYETDKRMLKRRAKEIGTEARRRAGDGPVTEEHARKASELRDCKTEEHWCY
jgi:hypothetical protein